MAQGPMRNGYADDDDTGAENGGYGSGEGRGRRPRQDGQQPGGPPRRGRFQPRRKVCIFCVDKDKVIDWKKFDQLRRFIGDSGEIYPRRKSGLCARHQRGVALAIKRARQIALLPYTGEHIRVMGQRS